MHLIQKVILILMVLSLTACGGSSKNTDESAPQANYEYSQDTSEDMRGDGLARGPAESGTASPLMPEKVITTMDLEIETRDYDKTRTALFEAVGASQGYIVYSSESTQYATYASFTIRIPREGQAAFDTALTSDSMGKVISRSTGNEDVTRTYNDMEARIKVLEEETARLSALAEKAGDVGELLEIQKEITRSISDRESLMSQLLTMKEKVDFITYHLEISLVQEVKNRGTIQSPFGERVSNAFSDSITGMRDGIQNLIIFLVRNWFNILVFIAVIALIKKGSARFKAACPIRKRMADRNSTWFKKPDRPGENKDSNPPQV